MILLLLFLLCFNTFYQLDPDLGWHLFLGQNIVEKHRLVDKFIGYNYFSYIQRPDHEWLSNIVLYLLNSRFGPWSLVAVFISLLCLTIYLLQKTLRRLTVSTYARAIVLTGAILAYSNFFGVRVQFFFVFVAALLLFVLIAVKQFRLRLICYFLIFLIANNFHGGLIALAPIPILLEWNSFLKNNLAASWRRALAILIAIITAVSINPYGLDYWRLLGNYLTDNSYQRYIAEWRPIYDLPVPWVQAIFPLSVIIFILTINNYWRRLKAGDLILIAIYGYLGCKYRRHFPLLITVIAPYFGQAIDDFYLFTRLSLSKQKVGAIFISLLVVVFFSREALSNKQYMLLKNMPPSPFNTAGLPVKALDYIDQNHPKGGRFFNCYGWGGYIVNNYPDLPVFIDGRGPEQIISGKKSILEEYSDFYLEKPEIVAQKLKDYDISYILIQQVGGAPPVGTLDKLLLKATRTDINTVYTKSNNLVDYLNSSDHWSKVYSDNIALVYFRKQEHLRNF